VTSGAARRGRGSAKRARGDVARLVSRGIGQALITAGLILLLFVVYEVWVSNYFADRKQAAVHRQLATTWQAGRDPLRGEDRLPLPLGRQVLLPSGIGFANLYIPRFGRDYAETVVEGVGDADLDRGPGHYPDSQLPGQIGNFAMAGHRVGQGEPFLNLDRLRPGDPIVVQTASRWYVYDVLGDNGRGGLGAPDAQGVLGREIVRPGDVGVVDPVPNRPGLAPTRALLTMTTCHPKYTANQRLVVHAALVRAVPTSGTRMPRELSGGTL
jgi:sortase A